MLTRNGYNIFLAMFADAGGSGSGLFQTGELSARDTGGVITSIATNTVNRGSINCGPGEQQLGYSHGFTTPTLGIVVGTGTTAPTVNDYVLQAPIASGDLTRGAMVRDQEYDTVTGRWLIKWRRMFTNNTGTSKTIAEVGLVWNGTAFQGVTRNFLVARDVLASAIVLDPGQQTEIRYVFGFAVP